MFTSFICLCSIRIMRRTILHIQVRFQPARELRAPISRLADIPPCKDMVREIVSLANVQYCHLKLAVVFVTTRTACTQVMNRYRVESI